MDADQLKVGERVRLRAFGNREIVRRFVGRDGATVHVCSEEEYEAASKAKRAPECIGFPEKDLIEGDKDRP